MLNLNSQLVLLLAQKLVPPQVTEILKDSLKMDNYELLPALKSPSEKDKEDNTHQAHRPASSGLTTADSLSLSLFDLLCKDPANLELGKLALAEYLGFQFQITEQQVYFQEYNSQLLYLAFRALFNHNSDTTIPDLLSLFSSAGQPQPSISS